MNVSVMSIAANSPHPTWGALRVMAAGAMTWEVKLYMVNFAGLWICCQPNNHKRIDHTPPSPVFRGLLLPLTLL